MPLMTAIGVISSQCRKRSNFYKLGVAAPESSSGKSVQLKNVAQK
jgi:hypothetical protein